MQRKINRLFPKILGVYTFDNHKKYEKQLVFKCDNIKSKGTLEGGKNWISQSVYNTENTYDVNKDKEFAPITEFLRVCALDYCRELNYDGVLNHTNTFFNIYNKYDYQDWHDHPGTHLSGVYCLAGEKGSADIHFTDFNNRLNINVKEFTTDNSTTWKEEFIPGKFLIFRSDLLHCVNRHNLDSKRYSLATNFNVQ
tara:strand:- start:728 stop:1315 length:588 start_codon:yes stop_codon:yes gene_type:complete